MLLKAPHFWYKKSVNKFVRAILSPLSRAYSFFAAKIYKQNKYRYRSKAHVVAVGGITIGGSGKTPVVASMCEILGCINKKAAVISRGFGRSSHETLKVDSNIHTFADVGDEPLMLSKYTDTFVSDDRVQSAKMAEASGHNLLLLDDGLMQKDLECDVKIVVVDSTQGFGNGEMLPLGPNRLSFDIIKNDLDSVVIIQSRKNENIDHITQQIPKDLPIIVGYLQEDFSHLDYHKRYLAFCGIGYPRKFFNSLKKKLDVVKEVEFPDHHPYSDDEIIDLLDEAKSCNAQLITTEKDLQRIRKIYRQLISVVSIKVVWKDTAKIARHLNCAENKCEENRGKNGDSVSNRLLMPALMLKLFVASDHAGFQMKENLIKKIKEYAENRKLGTDVKIEVINLGTDSTESCDYPIFADRLVTELIKSNSVQEIEHSVEQTEHPDQKNFGLLICGTGIGMSIAANRHPKIRAALCFDEDMAIMSRKHNNANVLVIGARVIDEDTAFRSLLSFLQTDFEGERHERRLSLLDELMQKYI